MPAAGHGQGTAVLHQGPLSAEPCAEVSQIAKRAVVAAWGAVQEQAEHNQGQAPSVLSERSFPQQHPVLWRGLS